MPFPGKQTPPEKKIITDEDGTLLAHVRLVLDHESVAGVGDGSAQAGQEVGVEYLEIKKNWKLNVV